VELSHSWGTTLVSIEQQAAVVKLLCTVKK